MKKILPVAIVVGVISLVACAGMNSCSMSVEVDGARVLQADARFDVDRRDAYSDKAYNMGMFDYVQDNYIYRQTAYLSFDSVNDFTGVSFTSNTYYVYCTLNKDAVGGDFYRFAGTYNGVTSQRGFGYCNVATWFTASNPGESDTGENIIWFDNSAGALFFCIRKNNLGSLTRESVQSYIDEEEGVHVQYRLADATPVHINTALNGDNASEAYQDGLDFALPRFKPDVRIHVETSDAPANVWPSLTGIGVELYLNTTDTSQYRFLHVSEDPYVLDLPYMQLGDTDYFFNIHGDDLRFSWFIDIEYSGEFNAPINPDDDWSGYSSSDPLFMPWWEGRIDIYIDVRDSSSSVYDNSVYFGFPLLQPRDVDVGQVARYYYYLGFQQGAIVGDAERSDVSSEAYGHGYNDGRSEGYSEGRSAGYSNGYVAGEQHIDHEGQAVNNIFGALVNIPINVLNGLMPLTIWSTPLMSVLFSFLFLGIVIWLVRKFI